MYNPLDLIPKTIDKNLRDIIVYLILIQFFAFLILFLYLLYEFIHFKLYGKRIVDPIVNSEDGQKNNLNLEGCEESKVDEIKLDDQHPTEKNDVPTSNDEVPYTSKHLKQE